MGSGARRKPGDSGVSNPAPPVRRRWLWFRSGPGARKKAHEEYKDLPEKASAGLSKAIDRYLSGKSRRGDVDFLGSGIYEIRYRFSNNHYRVLFTLWGSDVVALTAFYKNQQKTPKSDLDRAIDRARQWRDAYGDEPQAGQQL